MRLMLGIGLTVPVGFCIPILLSESGTSGLHLKGLPIKRNCGAIEEGTKQFLVPSVGCWRAQLVEVKHTCAKDKVMGYLLDMYLCPRSHILKDYHSTSLSVALYILINLLLHFVIPQFPVSLTHHMLLVFLL